MLVACSKSRQHASVSQGRICSNNFACYHTEVEAADQTFYLTQSQYTDTRPISPSTDPKTQGTWLGSHWIANSQVTSMTRPGKIRTAQAGFEPRISCSRGWRLTHWANEAVVLSVLMSVLRDQGQVSWRPTTVKWRQSSQSNRHFTIGPRQTQYHETLPSSANDELRCDCTFGDFLGGMSLSLLGGEGEGGAC